MGIKKIYYPAFLVKFAVALSRYPPLGYLSRILTNIADIVYLAHFVIKSGGSDILIGNSTPLLSLFFPEKTLIIMHDLYLSDFAFKKIFRKKYLKCKFLFCSNSFRKIIAAKYPTLHNGNFFTLYNAVDPQIFKPVKKSRQLRTGKLKLLFTSSWTPQKGLDILLDSLLLIPMNIRKNISLTVSSNEKLWSMEFDKDYKKYLSQIKRKMSLCQNITLLGGVAYKDMPKVYPSFDYLVFPSVWIEPFGLTVLEAIASGLPVITFGGGGIDEITSKNNSIIVSPKTPEAISTALMKCLKFKPKQNKANKSLLSSKNIHMTYQERYKRLAHFISEAGTY